jgi:hypothetical protein
MADGDDSLSEVHQVIRAVAGNSAAGVVSGSITSNLSAQIVLGLQAISGTIAGAFISTKGWIDTRGRNG